MTLVYILMALVSAILIFVGGYWVALRHLAKTVNAEVAELKRLADELEKARASVMNKAVGTAPQGFSADKEKMQQLLAAVQNTYDALVDSGSLPPEMNTYDGAVSITLELYEQEIRRASAGIHDVLGIYKAMLAQLSPDTPKPQTAPAQVLQLRKKDDDKLH